jgi:hypothetical protein
MCYEFKQLNIIVYYYSVKKLYKLNRNFKPTQVGESRVTKVIERIIAKELGQIGSVPLVEGSAY